MVLFHLLAHLKAGWDGRAHVTKPCMGGLEAMQKSDTDVNQHANNVGACVVLPRLRHERVHITPARLLVTNYRRASCGGEMHHLRIPR
jgi:hypothetical protein